MAMVFSSYVCAILCLAIMVSFTITSGQGYSARGQSRYGYSVHGRHHRYGYSANRQRGTRHSVHGRHSVYSSQATSSYDVTKFGAVGNGMTDDSQALESAWKEACGDDSDMVQLKVPTGKTFLVSRVLFYGPCKSKFITFKILGNIVAPQRSNWNTDKDAWLYFYKVSGLSVVGNNKASIQGNGASWWGQDDAGSRPTALKFSNCDWLQVRGLISINSQRNHISINECTNVNIAKLRISAPDESPNTDGINISGSTNVTVEDSVIGTGDDCIAIIGGTHKVNINGIRCGPGHGISIGSLGRSGSYDEVENIRVQNCSFHSTQNGVRIKTWQGGSGFARDITFSDINFDTSDNPVIIDQYYCPHMSCGSSDSAVQISNVNYIGLRGTSISENATINFSCSSHFPCTGIQMKDVNIVSLKPTVRPAQCINAYGTAGNTNPATNCLNH